MDPKKIALITGASSGLGREFATQLEADPRWGLDEVWLVARRRDKLSETAGLFLRIPARTLVLDVTSPTAARHLADELDSSNAVVALWINNAGYGTYGLFANTPLDRQLGMIDLNVRALTQLSHLALDYMEKDSVLINVASLAVFYPLAHFAVYAATKAYVLNFSAALAAEVKDRGILVHALCPGRVRTEFAEVASAGGVKMMTHGQDPRLTVRRCLSAVRNKAWFSVPAPAWKAAAWLSRWVSRKSSALFSLIFMRRESAP